MMPGAAPGAQSAPPAFYGFKRPPNLRQSSPSLGGAATRRLRQGFASGGMGFRVSLQCSNPERLMSALGQKQTSQRVGAMSALPPKADIAESDWHVRFVPKADIATSQFAPQIRHSRPKLGMGTPCIRRSLLLLSYKPNQSLALYRVSRSQYSGKPTTCCNSANKTLGGKTFLLSGRSATRAACIAAMAADISTTG